MTAARRTLAAVALTLTAALSAGAARAEFTPRVLPDSPYIVPQSPYRLGFAGQYNGRGMLVRQVQWGSIAHRIGLERGDVVVSINGQRIFGYHHYLSLLAESGGFVRLGVRDVNTGRLVTMQVNLNPVVPAFGGAAGGFDPGTVPIHGSHHHGSHDHGGHIHGSHGHSGHVPW
ncbi:MAG TPA: PDZ domain-containing protein [Lacipirellulaceae bacterium]|nr:PDZ domain-containing protein [Lacipirellulaceae bacterium]